jgi:hypothetical protein
VAPDREPSGSIIYERKASFFISTSVLRSFIYSTSTGASIPAREVLTSGLTSTRENNHTSAFSIVTLSILCTPVSVHCSVIKGLVLLPVVIPVV